MKRHISIYFLGIIFFISSCANVDKMVDRGNYDQVLALASKKLAGKKNKKTKYVVAAEEAFEKVTERDMARIRQLQAKGSIANWEKILRISEKMLDRQRRITPFLPLIDKHGYQANFAFVKAELIQRDAIDYLSKNYFDLGMEQLLAGRSNNIHAARKAFDYFNRALDFNPDDGRLKNLRNEAEQLGIVHVLVDVRLRSAAYIPAYLKNELVQFNNVGRRSQWVHFHSGTNNGTMTPHYISTITITDLDISPEHVREVVHNFTREIDETRFLRDNRGRVMRDSAGNKIEIIVPVEVRGRVFEFNQSKEAIVDMFVEISSAKDGRVVQKERMHASGLFENVGCRIAGDRRAIDGRWLEMGEPLPFPTDEALVLSAADELKYQVEQFMLGFPFDRV